MVDYAKYDDIRLQMLAHSGDRIAEEELALRYSRLVKACARPYFLIGADSEDLIQEGMFGLLSAIREFDNSAGVSFKTYAEVCVKRRLVSAIRAASRMKHTPLNNGVSLDDFLADESSTHSASLTEAFRRIPEEQVLARESAEEIFHTYSRCLSKLEIEVLGLYLEGLSYGEMAAVLGRSQKSIDNTVQRIRRKLARQPNLGDIS